MLSAIKALGLQDRVQRFSMVNIFFVGLPLAYIMAIKLGFGINGLWFGQAIGFSLNLFGYGILVLTADWEQISYTC